MAIGSNTPDKRDPPDNPHKHFGLEHLGLRTDDIETVVKRAVAEGATIMQGIAQGLSPGTRVAFIMAPENTMVEISEVK